MFRFCRIGNTNLICYRNGTILRQHESSKKWHVCGTKVKNGYIQIKILKRNFLCHRIIAHAFGIFDLDSKLDIDHRDRNPSNNCIFNLRAVTHQKNSFNTDAKGYYWNKKDKRWKARIKLNRKHIWLGRFEKEEDARNAYLEAKKIYHII